MVRINELYEQKKEYEKRQIVVEGWIRTVRSSSNFGFIEINDGSSFNNLQIVFSKDLPNFDEIGKFSIASTIRVEGEFVLTENAKQPFEIQAKSVDLIFSADKDYPLQKKRHTFEFLRTISHLRPRSNTFMAVFRVRSLLAQAIHRFFEERGFVYIHTPIITSADAEGAGEVFRVTTLDLNNVPKENGKVDYNKDFFGKETFLTVSGQLAAESFALAFGKVYTFGPTFRSENSNTVRHASEFWMIEPEMAFCDLDCNMDVIEDMMKYIIKYVLKHAPSEMEFFNTRIDKTLFERLNNVLENDFIRITYTDAIELLSNSNEEFEYEPNWGVELQTEHEKYIAKHFNAPVFITDYPKDVKAFYMKQNPDGKTVRAVDLIVPNVGEIVGGSQREDDYELLLSEMKKRGMDIENYNWYLDLRRYGSAVHSGFGLGFERAVQYITGMANIRDVIPYPRTPKNADM